MDRVKRVGSGLLALVVGTAVCLAGLSQQAAAFSLTSSGFKADGDIPPKYTCEGSEMAKARNAGDVNAGVSPGLSWDDPPAGTKGFVLLVNDPDAPGGTWMHWVLFDIPSTARAIAEGSPKNETLADGSKHGLNDWRNPFYQGPCPPRGDSPHRYVFTLYALDAPTGLEPGAKTMPLQHFIAKHTLGKAELIGRFGR